MSSLFILNRVPILGLNSEYRLQVADQQSDIRGSFCPIRPTTPQILERIRTFNATKIAGCIPGISIVVGVGRLKFVYDGYHRSAQRAIEKQNLVDSDPQSEEGQLAAAWLRDRKWTCIKMGLLALAEISQMSVLLLGAHLSATVFDHVVAACYRIYSNITHVHQQMV